MGAGLPAQLAITSKQGSGLRSWVTYCSMMVDHQQQLALRTPSKPVFITLSTAKMGEANIARAITTPKPGASDSIMKSPIFPCSASLNMHWSLKMCSLCTR